MQDGIRPRDGVTVKQCQCGCVDFEKDINWLKDLLIWRCLNCKKVLPTHQERFEDKKVDK